MKTLFFSLLFIAVTTFTQAQEITQLEEAKVGFAPLDAKITRDAGSYIYRINENYTGEFVNDPIAFMKANFNIQNFMEEVSAENYDSFQVTFKSTNGHLKASFNNDGELVKTFQKFKDIVLPLDVRREVYMANKGWTMTSNKYIASGTGDVLDKATYKIKLENGNKKQTIKLDGRAVGRASVASN